MCVDVYRDIHLHTQTDRSRPRTPEGGFRCRVETGIDIRMQGSVCGSS